MINPVIDNLDWTNYIHDWSGLHRIVHLSLPFFRCTFRSDHFFQRLFNNFEHVSLDIAINVEIAFLKRICKQVEFVKDLQL